MVAMHKKMAEKRKCSARIVWLRLHLF